MPSSPAQAPLPAPWAGGGVSGSLGRGTPELDFRVSASPPPSGLDTRLDSRLSSTHLTGRRVLLTAADVSAFCGSLFDDTDPMTGLVCCATAPARSPSRSPFPGRSLDDRAPSRLRTTTCSSLLGWASPTRPSSAPFFKSLAGIGRLSVPAGYEPLDESTHLAAGRAFPLRHRRDGASLAIANGLGIRERWYKYWTRMFEYSPDGKTFGFVFVEA